MTTFWRPSEASSSSASPTKTPAAGEAERLRRSGRSHTAASSSQQISSMKDDSDMGSNEEDGEGPNDKLEVKRAKNRVKQRNLRQRRAEHVSALEQTTNTLHYDLAEAQAQVSNLQQRESHLQSWVRDLETALFRHGLSSEVEMLRRVWALPPISIPLSAGAAYHNHSRVRAHAAAPPIAPVETGHGLHTLAQLSNVVLPLSGSGSAGGAAGEASDRSRFASAPIQSSFALSAPNYRLPSSISSSPLPHVPDVFHRAEAYGNALHRTSEVLRSSSGDLKRRRSDQSDSHGRAALDHYQQQQTHADATARQSQLMHVHQSRTLRQQGRGADLSPTTPGPSSSASTPLPPAASFSNETAFRRPRTEPATGSFALQQQQHQLHHYQQQQQQQLAGASHRDGLVLPPLQSNSSADSAMLPPGAPSQASSSTAASPKPMRIEDLLSPMGNQSFSETTGVEETQVSPGLEPQQDFHLGRGKPTADDLHSNVMQNTPNSTFDQSRPGDLRRAEGIGDDASTNTRLLLPFVNVPEVSFAESPSAAWMPEELFKQVLQPSAYQGFPMISNTLVEPEIDFQELEAMLADRPQEVFPLFQANSEGTTYMYPFGVETAPPAYQEQSQPHAASKDTAVPAMNIVATPALSPNINTARQMLLALLPADCDLKPPIRLPILTPGQQVLILKSLADLSPAATQPLFLSRQLRSLPAPLAKLLLSYQSSPHPDERIVLLPIAILRARIIQLQSFGVSIDVTAMVQSMLQHGRVFGDPLDPEGWELPAAFWDTWSEFFPPGRAYCGGLAEWRRRDGHGGSSVAEMLLGVEAEHARRTEPVGWPMQWRQPESGTEGRVAAVVPIQ